MVLRRKISMRFMGSRARMCSAPVHPSTISSIFTPSCQGTSAQPRPWSSRHVPRQGTAALSVGTGTPPGQVGFWGARLRQEQGRGAAPADTAAGTHRVGLLCAGCYVPLGVLVSLDQQLDQAGDDGGLLERGMVGRAQGQVADQAYGSLEERKGGEERFVSTTEQCAPHGTHQPGPLPLPVPPHPPPWRRLTSASSRTGSGPVPAGEAAASIDSSRAAGRSHFLH